MLINKAIIYGGAGFIGSALAKKLASSGTEVYIIEKEGIKDKESYNRISDMNIELIECDLDKVENLSDRSELKDSDIFYQFAWDGLDSDNLTNANVQVSNINYILKSIEVAKKLNCKKFIGAGSISESELFSSEGRLNGNNKHRYYRSAQLACETIGRYYAEELGIEFIWPRIINIYGPGENSGRLIYQLISNLKNGQSMKLSSGKQLYDFLYIDDAAEAYKLLGEKGENNKEYVIKSGKIKPLKDFLIKVRDEIAPDIELEFGSADNLGVELDDNDLNNNELLNLGFVPRVEFEKGIRLTCQSL